MTKPTAMLVFFKCIILLIIKLLCCVIPVHFFPFHLQQILDREDILYLQVLKLNYESVNGIPFFFVSFFIYFLIDHVGPTL